MDVDVTVIDSILLEHTAIKHSMVVLREAMAEQATFLLKHASGLNRTDLKQLKDNHLRLCDSLQAFNNMTIQHCSDEEKALSTVLGTLIAKGNVTEHREIISYLKQAQSLLNETQLLGNLKPAEIMATTYNVQQTVEMACRLLDAHETNEAGMLALLKRTLNVVPQKTTPVASTQSEITGLMQEHEAIRAQMKFITDALASLTTRSIQANDRINGYRMSLYDLRDGMRQHTELDEKIFQTLLDSVAMEDITTQHNEIQKQMNRAIRLVDNAVAEGLEQKDLNKRVSAIEEAIKIICELVEAHTAKEDSLLKSA